MKPNPSYSSRQQYLKHLTLTALFTALAMSATFVRVPAGPQGYANLGDAMILTAGMFTGGISAMIAGGLGSCLTDVMLGYPMWAPFTLIIKGLEGFLAGLLLQLLNKKPLKTAVKITLQIVIFILSSAVMIGGYFVLGAYVVYGNLPIALAELPFNAVQGGISIAVATVIAVTKEIRLGNNLL